MNRATNGRHTCVSSSRTIDRELVAWSGAMSATGSEGAVTGRRAILACTCTEMDYNDV